MAAAGERDDQLFERSQSGEEAAFVSLYRRWQGAIYRYSLRLTGSEPIAEDVTQEVFLALMDRASGFDPAQGSFSAYLYGIARNHVLRRLARESIFAPLFDAKTEERQNSYEIRNFQHDPLKDLTQQERIDALYCAVATLPLRYREVVVLCEFQEMSYAEAAQVIGCPEGTIRSRLHRARTLLFHKLQEVTQADSRTPEIVPARCIT